VVAAAARIYVARMKTDQQVDRDIAELQRRLTEEGARWTARRTSVSHLTHEELFGAAAPRPKAVAPVGPAPVVTSAAAQDAPTRVDWRDHGGKSYVSEVLNQHTCYSCSTFALSSTVTAAARVLAGLPTTDYPLTFPTLSPAQPFAAAGGTCGAFMKLNPASKRFRIDGVVPESWYGDSQLGQPLVSTPFQQELKTTVPSSDDINDLRVKAWLATSGPVTAEIYATEDFKNYGGGIYEFTYEDAGEDSNHGVVLVGYDDTEQAWLIQNSWGENWGDGGFAWIAYEHMGVRLGAYSSFRAKTISPVYTRPEQRWALKREHAYDEGEDPCVAINGDNIVVEFHQDQNHYYLWYHVGVASGSSKVIDGTKKAVYLGQGAKPRVAVSGNTVVAVNETNGPGWGLWQSVGTIDPEALTISWGDNKSYDTGDSPAVAMAGSKVVEVHAANGELSLRQGTVSDGTLTWVAAALPVGTGSNPTVAINDEWLVVVAYERSGTLYYRIADFGNSMQGVFETDEVGYDLGKRPCVAMDHDGHVVETHYDGSTLWCHAGNVIRRSEDDHAAKPPYGGGIAIDWGTSVPYDTGMNNAVAMNGHGVYVEVHRSPTTWGLWQRAGVLEHKRITELTAPAI
jgi:hypothetical protein